MTCIAGLARTTAVLTFASLTSACPVGPDYVRPSVETPLTFKEAAGAPVQGWKVATPDDDAVRDDWWSIFHDFTFDA